MSLLQQFFYKPTDANADKRITLMDGKATLYKRPSSSQWQVRFKLANNKWHTQSTNTTDIEEAKANAIFIYQTVQVKTQSGLAPNKKTFKQIAKDEVTNLTVALERGTGKITYKHYLYALAKYIIAFFGNYTIDQITPQVLADFEAWRIAQMGKAPMASTKRCHACAYARVITLARERGYVGANQVVPMLDSVGERSKPRPAFTDKELQDLLAHIPKWVKCGMTERAIQARKLCGFYIGFLVGTGVRCGKEAMPLRWKHLQWHYIGEQKYLRIWVTGKTGPRYLIAKHEVVAVLEELMRWQKLPYKTLDAIIEARLDKLVFRLKMGTAITNVENMFKGLMVHSGLRVDSAGQIRTLYSLRHTYATKALAKGIDIHTLAKQMGTSVGMIERHYSKLTATMAADRLA